MMSSATAKPTCNLRRRRSSSERVWASTSEGLQLEATAFAGDRFHINGGAELGGVAVEGTAEAWAGIGCTAAADLSFKDGKINVELSLGAALGVGAKLGLGFSIDVCDVRDNLVNAAEDVGAFVIDAAEHVSYFVVDAGHEVRDAVNHVANKVEKAAHSVGRFFSSLF